MPRPKCVNCRAWATVNRQRDDSNDLVPYCQTHDPEGVVAVRRQLRAARDHARAAMAALARERHTTALGQAYRHMESIIGAYDATTSA